MVYGSVSGDHNGSSQLRYRRGKGRWGIPRGQFATRQDRYGPTLPEVVDEIAGPGRSMKDTKGDETCGRIGNEKETDLEGHYDVRENPCHQITPVI